MKTGAWIVSALLVVFAAGTAAPAEPERRVTLTLLPAKESGAVDEKLLWAQTAPAKDIFLQFDLRSLPEGLREEDFLNCTLRLVAKEVTYIPAGNPDSGGQLVILKGQTANDDFTPIAGAPEVVSLRTLSPKNRVAIGAAGALAKAVYREYAGDKLISFRVHTDSHKASSLLYSTGNFGDTPSQKPRLALELKLPPAPLLDALSWTQHQQNPEHTGRSPWAPLRAPTAFTLAKIALPRVGGNAGAVADYPLLYRGGLYVIVKILDENYLIGLDFKGAELWRRSIGKGTVQRSPVISPAGILYAVTETRIAGYDLGRQGQDFASYPWSGKLASFTDLTQGNEGSLFLALTENDLSYIYGFTPDLKPFLKSGPHGKGQERISTVTVSPDGRKLFAQSAAGAVTLDVTDPVDGAAVPLGDQKTRPWEYYHVPMAGPAGNVAIYADFTSNANKGNLWSYAGTAMIWSASDTLLPQPVLGANGRVYYIQGGRLQGHRYDQRGAADVSAGGDLNSTSNLVMDGADHIFFWDNGTLHGYDAAGKALFAKIPVTAEVAARGTDPKSAGDGPEHFIRLMLGPDGTLWANNKNGDTLYAFKPGYASADLTLEQADIRTRTAYRAAGTLRVGAVTVGSGTQILLQAQNGIGFAPGFKVEKGASLLARTGF